MDNGRVLTLLIRRSYGFAKHSRHRCTNGRSYSSAKQSEEYKRRLNYLFFMCDSRSEFVRRLDRCRSRRVAGTAKCLRAERQRGHGDSARGRRVGVAIIGQICTSRGTEIEFQKRHVTPRALRINKLRGKLALTRVAPRNFRSYRATFVRRFNIRPEIHDRNAHRIGKEGMSVEQRKRYNPRIRDARCYRVLGETSSNRRFGDSRGKFDYEENGFLELLSTQSESRRISCLYVLI